MKVKPAYRMVFFDVDSTLVSIEGVDELAGDNTEVGELTRAAMNGEISVADVYARRLELIQPTSESISYLAGRYLDSLLPDARETITTLQNAGCEVHLVTAGIEQAIAPLCKELGIESRNLHAVKLIFDHEGGYAGFDERSPLVKNGGKELVILNVRARNHGKAVLVGDGMTDLEAAAAVDLFIGFGGVVERENVRARASVFIREPRLSGVIPIILGGSEAAGDKLAVGKTHGEGNP